MEPRTVTLEDAAGGVEIAFGDDAVGFDVELLLRAGGVLAFDDVVGGFEGCGDRVFGFVRRRRSTFGTA